MRTTRKYLLLLLIGLWACNNNHPNNKTNIPISKTKQVLVEVNRDLALKDKEQILAFIQRHKLKISESTSGLFYKIYGEVKGKQLQTGDLVTLDYKISLLDGTECYKSEVGKPKSFIVGHGGVESGLEEGILKMHEGQKAIFIMPPHLAHGLIGDMKKIPPRASIVYQLELINVQH